MHIKNCLLGDIPFIGSLRRGGGGVIEFLLLLFVTLLCFMARLYKYLTGMADAKDCCDELMGLVDCLKSIMLVA
jgi:hypothetical protein